MLKTKSNHLQQPGKTLGGHEIANSSRTTKGKAIHPHILNESKFASLRAFNRKVKDNPLSSFGNLNSPQRCPLFILPRRKGPRPVSSSPPTGDDILKVTTNLRNLEANNAKEKFRNASKECQSDEETNFIISRSAGSLILQYTKYLNYTNSSGNSALCDLIYSYEKVRDAKFVPRTKVPPNAAEKRAAIVDSIMSFAFDLQTFASLKPVDISRASVQLAISLLDRSKLIEMLPDDGINGLRCVAAFCLVTALQFEIPNTLAIEAKLKKAFNVDGIVREVFGMTYMELQRLIFDRIDCMISVPLSIDFAHYLLFKFEKEYGTLYSMGTNHSSIQLVCYLLDCFALTPEYAVTPANLAAAAVVQLARRITYPMMASNDLWTPYMESVTGYTKMQMRSVLKTINGFLTTKASKYPGLKRLHEKGWATVEWEVPLKSSKNEKSIV